MTRRLVGLAVVAALAGSSCVVLGGAQPRSYAAVFDRAIQVFPGSPVRVLGVDVGAVTDTRNLEDGVRVGFVIDDPGVQIPRDAQAAIVPVSLLGERYIQLLPAYEGGPTLAEGSTIPLERTAVPAEPDELLRSLQNYLGALDPQTVNEFVTNTATALDGAGEQLNGLIEHGAGVMATLARKRDDLATIIVQFERVASALVTRRKAIERVIHTYNDVVGTLTSNRSALEGSIDGLTQMSAELASLLEAHRGPLRDDIEALTRTSRTVSRNVETLARTGHWAQRLFSGARRAVDYEADWLRLNNQGQELEVLIAERLEERLLELCTDLGIPLCADARYWERNAPSLFCLDGECPAPGGSTRRPAEELADAIAAVPELADRLLERAREIDCADAPNPERCVQRKEIVLECLDTDDPRACLKEHDVPVRCLKADDVAACLSRKGKGEMKDAVQGLLDDAMNAGGIR